jgi:DNA-binding PadR family transcriptional regulator
MPEQDLPKEVRDLVIRQLHSMEEIEVLLLLGAERAGLTAGEIRSRLRLAESDLPLPSLDLLQKNRLISVDETGGEPRYSYAVTDASVNRAVDLLRIAYNERPVTLVRLVYNRPSAAQSFADAFRLGKEDKR